MMRKASKLIDFGYKPTFRQMMESYRFWMHYIKRHKIKFPKKMTRKEKMDNIYGHTEIKIIVTERGSMGGDCTSTDKCKFEVNPTLEKFVEWLKESKEWGEVYLQGNFTVCEYKSGEVKILRPELYEKVKSCEVELLSGNGGWGRWDYVLRLVKNNLNKTI